jgi:hypothetical protein
MKSFILAGGLALAGLAFAGSSQAQAHDPVGGYYGNSRHDLAPHWHKTYTPFGPTVWYGNGPHDLMPHSHSASPWGGVRSYGNSPFGPTKSYNGFPGYSPFPGGYGSYYGGYSGYGYCGFGRW